MVPIDPDALATSGPPTVCVVLSRPGDPESARLHERLAERRVSAVESASPVEAMAEVCLQERAQRARSAWGLQRSSRLALVVVDRSHWRTLSAMLEALGSHLPEASVWMCDEHLALQIHPQREGPKLRLAGDVDGDEGGTADPTATAVRTRIEATLQRSERQANLPEPAPTTDPSTGDHVAGMPIDRSWSELARQGGTTGTGDVSMSSDAVEEVDAIAAGLDAAVSAEELAMLLREEDSL
ncbi:MAG: hypothetical protein KDA22_12535 [Phycisphaerales bacterium]|nr:hypothetical protein [Phycisphaerales bacterium]